MSNSDPVPRLSFPLRVQVDVPAGLTPDDVAVTILDGHDKVVHQGLGSS